MEFNGILDPMFPLLCISVAFVKVNGRNHFSSYFHFLIVGLQMFYKTANNHTCLLAPVHWTVGDRNTLFTRDDTSVLQINKSQKVNYQFTFYRTVLIV